MIAALPKFGICAHPSDMGGDVTKVIALLKRVGIMRVRTDCPWNNGSDGVYAWCLALAKAGVTLTLSVNGWMGQGHIDDALGFARQLIAAVPGCIDNIEGANEVNNDPQTWGTETDPRSGDMTQRRAAGIGAAYLYKAVKADPVLQAIPVISYTDINAPAVEGIADLVDVHVYDNGTNGPLDWWIGVDALGKLRAADPDLAFSLTEFGVRDDTGMTTTQALQARYIVQALLTLMQKGATYASLYELCDDGAGPYGLFKADGTPKLSAAAVAGFLALTGGCGVAANAPTVTLDPSTTGDLGSVQQLMLAKPDGSFLQFMWTWNPPAKLFDLFWKLDHAVAVTGLDNSTFSGAAWGSWTKAAGELQDWKSWDGSPFVLELHPA